ncbi:MAG: hypothetical protein KIT63_25450 [Rhodoferax sp.]|nr:hypothetical protein [Rhodoferax sp.]
MMELGTRLAKTEAGRQEINHRSGRLSTVERRLLILVDAHKTINELGAFVRVGELEPALERLVGLGLVGPEGESVPLPPPVAPGFTAAMPQEPERPATSVQAFEQTRAEVARFVHNRLGEPAEPICEAIHRCRNPQELRALLRGIEVFIGQRLDPATTQAFARHFGSLLL